jgi:hypothetical protein
VLYYNHQERKERIEKMTKLEMVNLGIEFHTNYYKKYMLSFEKQYKYRGEIRTRKEFRMTEEGRSISEMLHTPMFTCPCCGQVVGFNDLEVWLGDDDIEEFMNDEIPCSLCYEDEMGDDL